MAPMAPNKKIVLTCEGNQDEEDREIKKTCPYCPRLTTLSDTDEDRLFILMQNHIIMEHPVNFSGTPIGRINEKAYDKQVKKGLISANEVCFCDECVSETKKKYVAAKQGWKCNGCGEQLNHTFQVDHKIDLQFGGTNNVENLAALCNNCHAMKTASNNLYLLNIIKI